MGSLYSCQMMELVDMQKLYISQWSTRYGESLVHPIMTCRSPPSAASRELPPHATASCARHVKLQDRRRVRSGDSPGLLHRISFSPSYDRSSAVGEYRATTWLDRIVYRRNLEAIGDHHLCPYTVGKHIAISPGPRQISSPPTDRPRPTSRRGSNHGEPDWPPRAGPFKPQPTIVRLSR